MRIYKTNLYIRESNRQEYRREESYGDERTLEEYSGPLEIKSRKWNLEENENVKQLILFEILTR